MFRISPAQPLIHLSATTSLSFSESVCHRLLRFITMTMPEQYYHNMELINRTLLPLSGTGLPGWYYTPDFADGSRLTLDVSIAGQVVVTAYGPGLASERQILTPVHPLWKYISNRLAQAKLLQEWCNWAAMPAPGEQRDIALCRVANCVAWDETELAIESLGLTTLPTLPATLKKLDVSGNQLTTLPELPNSLTELKIANNRLTTLPELPNSLTQLNVWSNQLTVLPALPDSLTRLNIASNQLTILPKLPNSLTELNIASNQLTTLPELPNSLTELIAWSNRLTVLPVLPDSLTRLNVNNNQLTTLPDLPGSLTQLFTGTNRLTVLPVLPDSLTQLTAWSNRLTALPDLPDSLIRLDVSDNFLSALPALPDSLVVLNIARNWLTTLPPLPALLEGRDVGFIRQRSVLILAGRPPSLPDSITRWYPAQRQESVRTIWTPLATEENAASFTKFLNQLNENICATSPVFREKVAAWLDELFTIPELRTLSFAMAQEASTSCTDRAALGWNNMQVARLLFHADRNEQATENEFITLARQIFRLRQLERIAGDKIRSLSAASARIDEIEVYLAYQTRLKEILCLPDILTSAMNFGALACVTQRDIHMAVEEVVNAEDSGFRRWLNNWEPCQQFLLKRMAADEQDALTEQRIAVFEEQLQHFRQEFSDAGSGTDVDRVLGVRATEATNDIIFGPLTGKMF